METYTPAQGLTQPGQQASNLQQALAAIQNMNPQQAPNVSADQVSSTQANAANYSANEPQFLQQTQQNLTQQAGIPQLQGQSQDMGKIFKMWLADQNIAQKYASPQLGTPNSPVFSYQPQNQAQAPFSGNYQGPPNPYLNSTQDVINAVTQPSGQGFQGFTTPAMNTSAMSVVPSAANNIIGILQNAIGSEQSLVSNKMGTAQTQYETSANLLNTIANLFSQERQSQLSAQAAKSTGGAGGFAPGSDEEAAVTFSGILDQLGTNATATDVWNYLNTHMTSLKMQRGQAFVDKLWKMQKDLSTHTQGKTISTGKVKDPVAAKKAQLALQKAETTKAGKNVKMSVDTKGNYKFTLPNGRVIVKNKPGLLDGIFGGGQRLKVKDLSSGQTGSIPPNEWDPNKYSINE